MTWFIPMLLWAPTLFDQAVVRTLQNNYPTAQFVLVDIDSKRVIGANWPHIEEPIPVGSLVKPFAAMSAIPKRFTCDPAECWRPKGHGTLSLEEAIADSCNSYFLQLAAGVVERDVRRVIAAYSLPQPIQVNAPTLTGLSGDWRWTPTQTALAFSQLATDPNAAEIRKGMLASAKWGTAKALHGSALAKTGTAQCRHKGKAPGDGYVVMLHPQEAPKYALLVQVHGVSGAVAAVTAAGMLNVVRDGK